MQSRCRRRTHPHWGFSYLNYSFDITNSDVEDIIYFSFLDPDVLTNNLGNDLEIVSSQTVTESDYKIPNRFYTDNDLDFVFDYLEDTNQDGNAYNDDFDGDGIPNFMDPDDDNDKIATIAEETGISPSNGKYVILGMVYELKNKNHVNLIICIFGIMAAIELRKSLIERFNRIIKDDSKLMTLDGVFDSINVVESPSQVSEEHYKIIEERRKKHLSGETKGKSWDDVKSGIRKKYGF